MAWLVVLLAIPGCTFDPAGVDDPNRPDSGGGMADARPGDAGSDSGGGEPDANPCQDVVDPCGFRWRRKLTIDPGNRAEALVDFPLLVRLDSNSIEYGDTDEDGDDLRFWSESLDTELDYDIERWDEDGTSYVWVKIPRIEAGAMPLSFWMYYGKEDTSAGERPDRVWQEYESVHHFEDDFLDASGSGHDGQSSAPPTYETDGRIAGAMSFDGADDHVVVRDERGYDFTTNMSISVWIQVESYNKDYQSIVTKGDRAWRLHRNFNQNGVAFDNTEPGGATTNHNGVEQVANRQWHHVLATYDGQRKIVYTDGDEDVTYDYNNSINNSDDPVYIGENFGFRGRYFHGRIDEVRISGVPRSATWALIEYLSQSQADFVTFETPEENP